MADGLVSEESKAVLWLHALVGCARGDKVDAAWLARLDLVADYS